jgi:hypothetical protein
MLTWHDVAKMREKYQRTGECDFCKNEGLLLAQVNIGGHAVVQGFPCNVCGQHHGYDVYLTSKYRNGIKEGSHIDGNLYAFPTDKRQIQMDNEYIGNGGVIPTKSPNCDNLFIMDEYRNKDKVPEGTVQ